MQALVSALQQTHHIFPRLFFFLVLFIVIGEAKLLHQLINAVQFSIDPGLLFLAEGFSLLQSLKQRVKTLVIFQ